MFLAGGIVGEILHNAQTQRNRVGGWVGIQERIVQHRNRSGCRNAGVRAKEVQALGVVGAGVLLHQNIGDRAVKVGQVNRLERLEIDKAGLAKHWGK